MKGSIISIIEVMLTGTILIVAFYFFFPQYVIRPKWDRVLLSVKVRDILNTIDGLNKTYEYAKSTTKFKSFMENITDPSIHGALVYWKETDLSGADDMDIPYFTEAYKESIVDVFINRSEYSVDPYTVALWHLNEDVGNTAYDETPNNNDGTWQDDTDYTNDCMFGYCLEFDGAGDYVNVLDPGVDSSLDIEEEITIEAWIKPRSLPPPATLYRAIISKSIAYAIAINDDGNITGIIYRPAGLHIFCVSRASVQLDEWIHVAMTYSSSTGDVTIFYNGNIDRICDRGPAGILTNNNDLRIGSMTSIAMFFDGMIDEVRISNTTRTSFGSVGQYDAYSFTLGLGYPY